MADIGSLVNRQVRMFELKRELERTGQRPPPVVIKEVTYGPCLLVSRECGTSGDEVADLVAKRLGWRLFNREIVDEISQLAHVRKQLVESVDEHVRSRWRRVLHPTAEPEGISTETYQYYLQEVLLALGHQGDVVIVGRGAQFVLPPECAVRVRMVDQVANRNRHISESLHMGPLEAAEHVRHCDADREAFLRKTFHQDARDPLNHDLVINTGSLNMETMVAMVLVALERKLGVRVGSEPCAS